MPADRVATLRKAFDATMIDPAFLEECKKLGLDIDPTNGDELTRAVNETIRRAPQQLQRRR